MKIAVSNIAWDKGKRHLPAFFLALNEQGITGVELALSCFWDEPVAVEPSQLRWLRQELTAHQLSLVSLHALTFTRPELELFASPASRVRLTDYLRRYCHLAQALDCPNLVFGSPKARQSHGRAREDCDRIFLDVLGAIHADSAGLAFHIEPLAPHYCDYLNRFMEGVALLDQANLENVFIQLDVRSLLETNEDLDEVFGHFHYVRHAHTSNPGLKPPGAPYTEQHRTIAQGLNRLRYTGYITAEVVNESNLESRLFLQQTVDAMKNCYAI